MKQFLLQYFTWWNGQTFGTQVWTALYGEFVGTDEFGNRYYRTKGGKIDKSLGFPTRFSYGFMLGAQVLSLFGPDTERAFGHLGFTNILGWADPERAVSCALITSGKPVLYPEIARFWGVGVRIGHEASKVAVDPLRDPLDARSA